MDVHAIVPDPFSNLIYAGNDGGLYSYDPAARSFNPLNSTLAVGQIQSIGPHPTNSFKLLAGFQDTGTQLYTGTLAWNTVDTSDGGFALFDHLDPNFAYHTYASSSTAQIASSTNGGMNWDFVDPTRALQHAIFNVNDAPPAFYPPLASDPAVAHRVFFGGHTIFVSTDGMFSWQQQTMQDLTAPGCSTGTSPELCALEDIEFARSDHRVAYAVAMSSSNGCSGLPCPLQVYTTNEADLNAGATWLNVTGNLGFDPTVTQATGIAIDPVHANIAYLAISGFTQATKVGHIFRTSDSGSTWTLIDGQGGPSPLPDIPVLKILVDAADPTGSTILAGTDIGVFRSTDTGASWAAFNAQLPPVPVFDMAQNDNWTIFIGTHGRGAYQLLGEPTATPSPTPTPTRPQRRPRRRPQRRPPRDRNADADSDRNADADADRTHTPTPTGRIRRRRPQRNTDADRNAYADADQNAYADADQDAYADADRNAYTHADRDAYADADRNAYADADQNAYADADQNAYTDADRNAYADADRNAYANADQNADADADQNAYTHADRNAYTHADRNAYTHADQNADADADQNAYAHADQNAYTDADRNAYAHADQNADAHADQHAHANADQNADAHADWNAYAHADQNADAHADQNAHPHADQNAYAHADWNAYAHADQNAYVDQNA